MPSPAPVPVSTPVTAPHPGEVFPPQVAGTFYPADPEALRAALAAAIGRATPDGGVAAKLVVAPHAGLVCSAHVAATAFAGWARRKVPVERVIVLAPAHRMAISGLALHPAGSWATPLGRMEVAWREAVKLLPLADVHVDARPFAGEHALEMHLLVLQAMLPAPFEIVPILVGDAEPETVAEAIERLWGGPETVISLSSDLSHYLDRATATNLDRDTARRIETLDGPGLDGRRACGHRILAGALRLAAERDLRATTLRLATSADVGADPGRVVGYGAFALEQAASARIGDRDRALLLDTCMAALTDAVAHEGRMAELVTDAPLSPPLMAQRATFVTLERGAQLRGCIGSLAPHRPLLGDAAINVVKAGFSDPRFGPLRAEELDGLDLSVSILSTPRAMAVTSEEELIAALDPDLDGLILADQGRSALFLPSVWRTLSDPRDFVRHLKQKAGLPTDHWSATMVARRFRTEKFAAPWRPIDPAGLAPLRLVRPAQG